MLQLRGCSSEGPPFGHQPYCCQRTRIVNSGRGASREQEPESSRVADRVPLNSYKESLFCLACIILTAVRAGAGRGLSRF